MVNNPFLSSVLGSCVVGSCVVISVLFDVTVEFESTKITSLLSEIIVFSVIEDILKTNFLFKLIQTSLHA
jgi:hypothetical protein